MTNRRLCFSKTASLETRGENTPKKAPTEADASHNPPELARLVIGCVPCLSEQLMIVGLSAMSEDQLRRIGRLGVGGKEAECPDDNFVPNHICNQQRFLHEVPRISALREDTTKRAPTEADAPRDR